jgi:hypothetical protein
MTTRNAAIEALKPFAEHYELLERNNYLDGYDLISRQNGNILGHAGLGPEQFKAARAALSLLSEPEAGEAWQTIETAPKNLTNVLVATVDGDVLEAQYECHAVPPFWSSDVHDLWDGKEIEDILIEPTHWRPLPAPPETAQDQKGETHASSLLTSPPDVSAAPLASGEDARSCTCHPDDNPPRPCPRKYALTECRVAAAQASPAAALETDAQLIERVEELQKKLESERQHHSSQFLTVNAAEERALNAIVAIARRYADDKDWSTEEENRNFRQIRYAFERRFRIFDAPLLEARERERACSLVVASDFPSGSEMRLLLSRIRARSTPQGGV